jgi:uncharacterized delta-60 repeat protein
MAPEGVIAMRTRAIALAVAFLLTTPTLGRSAPGDLDPAFGHAGKATASFGAGSGGSAVDLAPDGDIVVAGWIEGMFAVMRFRPGGALDTSFGDGGAAVIPLGFQGDEANAVDVRPNGTIVAVGTDDRERFVVTRILPSGALDATFGGDGVVRTPLAARFLVASDLAIQPDGRIVVVGEAGTDLHSKWAVARFRPNGRRDRSFGEDGMVVTPFVWGMALGVALQPDHRIVVTGYSARGLAVARYLPDGRLDRSFGDGDGKVGGDWPVPSPAWALTTGAVAIRSNGKIVLAGDTDIFAIGMARLLPDGSFDRTFGGDGIVRLHVAGTEQGLSAVALRPHGKVIAAGYAGPHESVDECVPRFVVIRVLADGSLDDTWGGDGRVATFFPRYARAWGAVLRPDGRLVVAGSLGLNMDEGVALARYLT